MSVSESTTLRSSDDGIYGEYIMIAFDTPLDDVSRVDDIECTFSSYRRGRLLCSPGVAVLLYDRIRLKASLNGSDVSISILSSKVSSIA